MTSHVETSYRHKPNPILFIFAVGLSIIIRDGFPCNLNFFICRRHDCIQFESLPIEVGTRGRIEVVFAEFRGTASVEGCLHHDVLWQCLQSDNKAGQTPGGGRKRGGKDGLEEINLKGVSQSNLCSEVV
jgi:hypothetical protein